MSKSNETFSGEFEQATTIGQESTRGDGGGPGRHAARLADTIAKYRARKTISLAELKRRVLGT
jgi:hypothetical protein